MNIAGLRLLVRRAGQVGHAGLVEGAFPAVTRAVAVAVAVSGTLAVAVATSRGGPGRSLRGRGNRIATLVAAVVVVAAAFGRRSSSAGIVAGRPTQSTKHCGEKKIKLDSIPIFLGKSNFCTGTNSCSRLRQPTDAKLFRSFGWFARLFVWFALFQLGKSVKSYTRLRLCCCCWLCRLQYAKLRTSSSASVPVTSSRQQGLVSTSWVEPEPGEMRCALRGLNSKPGQRSM